MPVKIPGKKSAIKRLGDARDLAKTLKKEGVTLDIQHNGKLVLYAEPVGLHLDRKSVV